MGSLVFYGGLFQAEENGLIKITIAVDSADSQSLCNLIIETPVYRRVCFYYFNLYAF